MSIHELPSTNPQVTEESSENIRDPKPLKVHRYESVIRFHFEQMGSDAGGRSTPAGVIRNNRSAIKKWRECFGLSNNSPVGEELGVRFEQSLAHYHTYLENAGNSKRTISARKSMIRALRDSYLAHAKLYQLPGDFAEALKILVENSRKTITEIARATDIKEDNPYGWMKGEHYPSPKALEQVHRLEDFFEVERGTLTSKFPEAYWEVSKFKRGTTPWREHQRNLTKPEKRYRLNKFPSQLQEEWDELYRCFTDLDWAKEQGLTLNSEWRVRWNTGRCPTEEIYRGKLSSFFGYLILDPHNPDPMIRGKGFLEEALSLALLSNAGLVIGHLRFMKGRSVTNAYNTATRNEISFCLSLLRPRTGYLWQRHEFAAKLMKTGTKQDQSQSMTKGQWRKWCELNAKKLMDFRKEIRDEQKRKNTDKKGGVRNRRAVISNPLEGKGKDGFTMTHNPFEAVIQFIGPLQHPLQVLLKMATKLESFIPLLKKGSPHLLAIQRRKVFQTRMVGANPLRVENHSMMTFIPADWDHFARVCKLYSERDPNAPPDPRVFYVETHESSNIYMNPDGSFGLRFNEEDFKNPQGEPLEEGILIQPYDVPIVKSVYPALMDYLFDARNVLNEELKLRINVLRAKRGLPLLTRDEELDIERCPFVYRPDARQLNGMSADRLAQYRGNEQVSNKSLSLDMYRMTQKYIPGCKGFCMNACRHFAASEYVRNEPDGERVAAAALHSSVEMIRRHYAWARFADRVMPWLVYHEELYKALEEGRIKEVAW